MKKRIIAFVCVLALLLSTPIASVEAASATDTYQVGFSKVDITPEDPTNLPLGGYSDQSTRLSVGVLTPSTLKTKLSSLGYYAQADKITSAAIADTDMYNLYASCVAITDQAGTTLLMLSLDVNNLPNSRAAAMRRSISNATGVPEENITVTATHTHSAPDLSYTTNTKIEEYVAKLDTNVAVCAVDAMANRNAATMWQNTVQVTDMNYVRHYYTSTATPDANGNSHVTGSNFGAQYGSATEHVKAADDDMDLLMFDFADNSQNDDIVVCNWRAHPCRDSSDSLYSHTDDTEVYYAISSDYVGPMRAAVKTEGYDLLFLQGAAGNIGAASKVNASATAKSSYAYGTELADYVIDGIADMQQLDTGSIQTSQANMPAEYNRSDSDAVAYALQVQAVYNDLMGTGETSNDNAITDPDLLEWVQNAYYTLKDGNGTRQISIYGSSDKSDTYLGAINDGQIAQPEAHTIANYLAWAGGYGSRYHINNIVRNENKIGSDTLQLNAITLGSDIAFVTAPVELFDSYTEDLKNYYGTRTFVMGYTNGYKGYLPDEDAFHYNATDVDGTLVYGGSYEVHTTDYAMGTGEKVAQTMKNMLDSMTTRQFCPCVGTHAEESDCAEITWEPWTATDSLPDSGNYYLTADVTVSGSIELQGTLNLDLNGKTIQGANGIYNIAKGDHLVVTDSYAGGQLGVDRIPIVASSGGKLTVYAGTIGGTIQNKGASVTLWGKPSMYINMAENAPAMDCRGLQTGANVYVVGAFDQCFARVSSAAQRACFRVQNDYNTRYDSGYLYLTSKQVHCVCGGSLSGMYNHQCEQISWTAWTATDSLPTTTGNYYLTEDVYLTSEQVIDANATIRLDLNGKTVYVGQELDDEGARVVSENGIRAYYVPGGSTLELTSSAPDGSGKLDGSACAPTTRDSYGGVIYADTDSTLNLYSNITISGNRSGSKKTATAVRGGCVYSLGAMTMYGGTITDGSVSGTGRRGGNVYTSGTFAMYGGTITNGAGNGINLYIDGQANATIGGTSYIYSGIVVGDYATLTLTGSPHIPDWTKNGIVGISFYSNTPIDATGLDTEAMAQIAPDGDATHCINIKVSDNTSAFATVSTPAQASFFESYNTAYGVHCYTESSEYKVALYDLTSASRYGCICGGKLAGSEGHTCDLIEWAAWTDTTSLPDNGNYYLTGNVTVSDGTALTGNLNLDLHGKTVTATGDSVYTVDSGKTLQITDSGSNGNIMANGTASNGGVINATGTSSKKAFVNLYGGSITGTATALGGGIYLKYSDFTMYGGTITNCSANRGGSIYLANYSTATIEGGTVENGTVHLSGSTTSLGGNISVHSGSTLNVKGGLITGGAAFGNNGNGGNICVYATANITGGKITNGRAYNLGDNIYVGGSASGTLNVSGGEICNPAEDHNIGLWGETDGVKVVLSGGKIYGGDYGIYNGIHGASTTLKESAYISGTSYGIYMNDSCTYDEETGHACSTTAATLTIDPSFTGTADVYWAGATADALGIAEGREIEHTTATGYNNTGTLICSNLDAHLISSDNGKLVAATVGIADGDSIISLHATLADALDSYELNNSADENYLQLYANQTDADITKSVYLDLNGHDMTVASVSTDCKIYGIDSVTNQYTHLGTDGADLCGKLTLGEGVSADCISTDVHINLTKGTTQGTRKYLALLEESSYTFHRYYLSLKEVGLRPSTAGIFYNAVFYGDEAVANAVDAYGVNVSLSDTFGEGTITSDYITELGATFQSGVLGNTGSRTVMTGIIPKNGATGTDYSETTVYGRAYITVNGETTLYSSNTGSANLQDVVKAADTAYGKNTLSAAQKAALDDMHDNYGNVMDRWGILEYIGVPSFNISDLITYDPKTDDELNILLIGNSFSYYWVEELYGLLAEGTSYDTITITNVYSSGCSLQKHWNWKETNADHEEIWVTTGADGVCTRSLSDATTLEDVITGDYRKAWDYISLQQNSGAFYKEGDYVGDVNSARETLEPYLGNLLSYLRENHPKAEYMWHQFWAHEIGTNTANTTVSNEAEQTAFHNALVAIGSEVSQLYGMTIVPTGKAWAAARADERAGTLLPYGGLCAGNGRVGFGDHRENAGDGYHDGDIGGGQLLNAYVWYMILTGDTELSDNNYVPATDNLAGYELSTELVAMLKDAAMSVFATE